MVEGLARPTWEDTGEEPASNHDRGGGMRAAFAPRARRRGADPRLLEDVPAGFEAVGEALSADAAVAEPCATVGRALARDGAGLGESLAALRATYHVVTARDPDFDAVEALSVAWSEATLEFLHDVSCEDPLTGLASRSHLRTRLTELYRDAERSGRPVEDAHALVLVETGVPDPPAPTGLGNALVKELRLASVADAVRAVFSGGETVGRLRPDRVAAVVERRPELGLSVGLLRTQLLDVDLGGAEARVWIEGMPASPEAGASLLDELSR
jgi:hypothetical protein